MPGDDMRKIGKAATLDVDCVCMDLEDGTALNRKQAARETIGRALGAIDFGRSERLVRINPVGSGMEADDLAATIDGRPDGYVLPKGESAEEVGWVCWRLGGAGRPGGGPLGSTNVLAIPERPGRIILLRRKGEHRHRAPVLRFGAEDLA